MSQYLTLPFRKQIILCGYMTDQYKKSWGYNHWGVDISSRQGYNADGVAKNDHVIYASGYGQVVWCQYDTPLSLNAKSLGYAIAIVYKDCVSHSGEVKDLTVRYMHCDTTFVKKGDIVHKGDPITVENKIGTNDYHLHLEVDIDTKNPQYTPQVSYGHSGWLVPDKKYWRTDIVLNPSEWLWQSEEYVQDPYPFSNKAWINEVDKKLPMVPTTSELETLKKSYTELEAKYQLLEEKYNEFHKAIEELVEKYRK